MVEASLGSARKWSLSPRGTRRVQLGLSSQLDSVLNGRDFDMSGENPHQDYMKQYGGYAGLKSGEKPIRPCKKLGFSQSSVADSVLWGKDIDGSGDNPHEDFMRRYRDFAGKKSTSHLPTSYKPNSLKHLATVDSVIHGKDIDCSGEDPHEEYMRKFVDHAGLKSRRGCTNSGQRKMWEFRSAGNLKFHSDTIQGVDESAPPHPHEAWMTKVNHGAAGVPAMFKGKMQAASKGLTMLSLADAVVYGREVAKAEDAIPFDDYAGRRSTAIVHKPKFSPPQRATSSGGTPQQKQDWCRPQRRNSRVNPFERCSSSCSTCSRGSISSSCSSSSLSGRPRWR